MPQNYEILKTNSGEILIRTYEEKDIEQHLNYLFESPIDFLESIGFDTSKMKSRIQWEKSIRARRAKAIEKNDPPSIIVAELKGTAISMVFLDQSNPDGVSRLHFHIFDPALRGKGLGGLIFTAGVKALAQIHGIRRFLIEPKASNKPMNGLMKKLGFTYIRDKNLLPGPMTQGILASQYEIKT